MIKGKRGVSEAVEVVLFFGFVVLAMAGVFFWAQGRTNEELGHTITTIEGSIECEDIRINVTCVGSSAKIGNAGVLMIDEILVRASDQDSIFENISLKPYQSIILSTSVSGNAFELVPVMDVNGTRVACSAKAVKEVC